MWSLNSLPLAPRTAGAASILSGLGSLRAFVSRFSRRGNSRLSGGRPLPVAAGAWAAALAWAATGMLADGLRGEAVWTYFHSLETARTLLLVVLVKSTAAYVSNAGRARTPVRRWLRANLTGSAALIAVSLGAASPFLPVSLCLLDFVVCSLMMAGFELTREEPSQGIIKPPQTALGGAEEIEELLQRKPLPIDATPVRPVISGQAVLVTGAAGSIGSELCRQVASLGPRMLVAFDQAESNLFRLDQELRCDYPELCVIPWIGDIRDAGRVRELMERHRFAVVFHAAAYKHVPMMEAHPLEVIRTNVLGTWNVLQSAIEQRASRFVLVSTDKAVHPASVMGLTKRIAELAVESRADSQGIQLAAVRFGNVLGSSGSVVPLFEEQINRGGPVTVTHPSIERYFMTIGEAVQLVLQAAAMTQGCETFLLDMGKPVRIADLASKLIEQHGLKPGEDIEIRYTGLRPGEKLVEDLIGRDECALVTRHPRILVLRRPRIAAARVETCIKDLTPLLDARNEAGTIAHLAALVPEYQPTKAYAEAREQAEHPTTCQQAAVAAAARPNY